MKIRKGDKVCVISGKGCHTGKDGKEKYEGKVLRTIPDTDRVIVEGHNMITKHQKARGRGTQAGIVKKEADVHVSNLMLVCPKCGKATRVGYEIDKKGEKQRVCKKCGAGLDK